jgi:SAM-dependent methyltransferase
LCPAPWEQGAGLFPATLQSEGAVEHEPAGDKMPPLEDAVARIQAVRAAVAQRFLCGVGIEVGAGSRPFPVPPRNARLIYGDIRDETALQQYFKADGVTSGDYIDAQTFAGVPDEHFDFVISAHVIEHLRDPLRSIIEALRIIKPGGVHILVVPEMRLTFDQQRPETSLEHVLADYNDGGEGTCREAYEEHLRFVHPFLTGENYSEAEIAAQATESARRWREFDIHFHAWSRSGFEALLTAAGNIASFKIESADSVENENIFVLRKTRPVGG